MNCTGAEISIRSRHLDVVECLLEWLLSQLLCFLSLSAISLPELQSPFHISADCVCTVCPHPTYLSNIIAGIRIQGFLSEEDCPLKCLHSLWLGFKVWGLLNPFWFVCGPALTTDVASSWEWALQVRVPLLRILSDRFPTRRFYLQIFWFF